MKIEKRGKYAGVKVHLDEKECEELIQIALLSGDMNYSPFPPENKGMVQIAFGFGQKLGKKIHALIEKEPDLLKERTPEQVQHELEVELESATLKIAAMKNGGNWKEIHID